MFGCATPDQLRRAFCGPDDSWRSRRVRAHAVRCGHCRALLERLTTAADPGLPTRRPVPAPAGVDPAALAGLLDRLRALPVAAAADPGPGRDRPGDEGSGGLEFLGPPVEPGELGTLGTYRIVAELGRGSMGVVLQGLDPREGRAVAIKVLPTGASTPEARARFEREARAAAQVDHPNVVPVRAVERLPDGTRLLVLELVPGPSLRERLEAGPPPAPAEAARWARQVAEGLAAAHRRGLVHRDIKPENVLMGPDAMPRLTDFGLARRADPDDELTLPGEVLGTPSYMSPEQATGAPGRLDARSDLYSLGVLLYELLAGTVPFPGPPRAVRHRLLHEAPTPPRRINRRVPRDLEAICLKAMDRNPSRRYATADALAADLDRFLAGRPTLARRPAMLARLLRRVRPSKPADPA